MLGHSRKALLIITAFLVLLLASEGVYQMRNNLNAQILYYLVASRFFAKTNSVQISLNLFEKAYETRLEQLSSQNSQELKKEDGSLNLPENQMLVREYRLILESLEIKKLTNTYATWGRVLYNFGLIAYENAETDLVIPYWEKAIAIAPEWSYFHIELANYYLSANDKESAKNQLEFCQKFTYPKKHCSDYQESNLNVNKTEPVGFLENEITGL